MDKLIKYKKSVIVSCDVRAIGHLRKLVEQTCNVPKVGGYKVGPILSIRYGLPKVVKEIRKLTDLPVIYDHQKGGTDIPALGKEFISAVKSSGADALILFPMSGPASEETWINDAEEAGLKVIVGGEMTHPKYKRSEGGYIHDDALDEMYLLAAGMGVRDFVVPGNKSDRIKHYKELLNKAVGKEIVFYSPGFILQGGSIAAAAKAAGERWHAIVGRYIYSAENMRKAASEITRKL